MKKIGVFALSASTLRMFSPGELARSCALGVFLACGPFLGIQILLACCTSYLFHLPAAPILATLCLINNPLTMIPIVFINHTIGIYVINNFLRLNLYTYEPAILQRLSNWLEHKFAGHALLSSIKISASGYLIGGLCWGIICAVIAYPIFVHLIIRMRRRSLERASMLADHTTQDYKNKRS